jgi:hypothetical protein
MENGCENAQLLTDRSAFHISLGFVFWGDDFKRLWDLVGSGLLIAGEEMCYAVFVNFTGVSSVQCLRIAGKFG